MARGSLAASSRPTRAERHGRSTGSGGPDCSRRSAGFEETHRVELAANEAYDHWRATARDTDRPGDAAATSKPSRPAELPEGRDQPVGPGLAGDAHRRAPRPAGLQRPGRGQRQADRVGGGGQHRPRTSGTSNRCSTPPSPGSRARRPPRPGGCVADAGYWHTAQMQTIEIRESRCSPRRTGTCAKAHAPAGTRRVPTDA